MARRKGSNTGIPGLSFSWKRATGISNVKRKIAKATGIPTTKSGRNAKIGRMVTGGGCLVYILIIIRFIDTENIPQLSENQLTQNKI
jgi:hypothetical protein